MVINNVHISVFLRRRMTSKDVKPLLLGVGERRETKDLGPGGSPGKNRPRALRGLRGPFDGQKLASEIEIF